MFIEGFEKGIHATEENLRKYQSGKDYLDYDRTEVLKSCSFYSKDLYDQKFVGFGPFGPVRESSRLTSL